MNTEFTWEEFDLTPFNPPSPKAKTNLKMVQNVAVIYQWMHNNHKLQRGMSHLNLNCDFHSSNAHIIAIYINILYIT